MQTLFQNVLTAGLHGSIVILAVLLLRLVLKKVPRKYFCLLWLLAILRLLMPFEIHSRLSLQPDVETLSRPEITEPERQPLPEAVPAVPEDAVLPPDTEVVYGDAFTPPESIPEGMEAYYPSGEEEEQHLVIDWNRILVSVWLIVAAGLVLYSLFSYRKLKRRVREAVRSRDGAWECAGLETAFILGWIRPRVYLPMGLTGDTRHHILRHERAHLRRLDHWLKLLGFAALCLHWFNPLVWAAWVLLCRDMELACDEQVVKDMGLAERKDYSAALLRCSTARNRYMVCPVAFGEVSVKTRILSVLNYRKPGFWITLLGVLAILFVTVFLMTSPGAREPDLSFLNYENAISLAADQNSILAIYCMDSSISPCKAEGSALAQYLDNADWTERWFEPSDLSSPGSVEFIIGDDYRITVFDRRFARVTYGEEVRYYRISRKDYEDALALVTTFSGEGLTEEESLIQRCREALDALKYAESYHILVSEDYVDTPLLNGISEAEYWKIGTNRMSRHYPDSDTCTSWHLEWLGNQYKRLDCSTWVMDGLVPYNWTETEFDDIDRSRLTPWFDKVNWETDTFSLRSHQQSEDTEEIVLNHISSDQHGEYVWTMAFLFDKEGTLLSVDQVLRSFHGDNCTGTRTVKFISFDSAQVYADMASNAQAPDIIDDSAVYAPAEEERALLLRCYDALAWHQAQGWRHTQVQVSYTGDQGPESDMIAEYWQTYETSLRRLAMADGSQSDGWLVEQDGVVYCKGIKPYYPEDITSYTLWVEAVNPEPGVMTTWLEEYVWDFDKIRFLSSSETDEGTVVQFRVIETLTDNLGGTAAYHDVAFCLDEENHVIYATDDYTINGTQEGEGYTACVNATTRILSYDREEVTAQLEKTLENIQFPD